MEHKLVFDMVLESHDYVVPNGAEPVLTRAHFLHDASVDMGIEMPALNVAHIASLDGHGEANRD